MNLFNNFMNENKMQKIDDVAIPIVDEIIDLMKRIDRKLPRGGSTMYRRSPIRSLRGVLKRVKESYDMLDGIE
jgi:hypothetical protein